MKPAARKTIAAIIPKTWGKFSLSGVSESTLRKCFSTIVVMIQSAKSGRFVKRVDLLTSHSPLMSVDPAETMPRKVQTPPGLTKKPPPGKFVDIIRAHREQLRAEEIIVENLHICLIKKNYSGLPESPLQGALPRPPAQKLLFE